MTAIELELRKAEMARMILNESDEKMIGKLFAFLAKEKKAALPCRYTLEELKESFAQSEADIKAGRTVPTAEVFKPYERWL